MRTFARSISHLVFAIGLSLSLALGAMAQEPPSRIENGDVNGDGQRDLSDALYFLSWLFIAGPEPVSIEGETGDEADPFDSIQNGDVNGDGARDTSDVVRLLDFLHAGGGAAIQPIDLYVCDAARQYDLRRHLPRVVSHAGTDALTLWGAISDGIGRKPFARATGWNRYWSHHGNAFSTPSTAWGKSLPTTSGFENAARVVFGAFAFLNGSTPMTGIPFLDGAMPPRTYHAQSAPSPSQPFQDFFYPRTVVATADGSKACFFGIQDDDGQASSASLRYPLIQCETSWSPAVQSVPSAGAGVTVRFTDHGLPTLSGGQPFGVEPGPNSACSMSMTRRNASTRQLETKLHHFVFVTARFLTSQLFDKVTYLEFDGANWVWGADLGSPVPNAEILDGPLAYTYKNNQGRYNMSVWVVARDRMSGDANFRLYEKFFVDAGNESPIPTYFTGWTNHGFPSGPYSGAAWPAGTRFHMTTGMTWGLSTGLRNNLFGWAEGFTEPGTGVSIKKKLIEHYFDNSSWQWGMILSPPDGLDFRTESCAVVETPTYRRLSVVGRSGAGSILELAYTFTNGVENGWFWTDLSCEPGLIVVPR